MPPSRDFSPSYHTTKHAGFTPTHAAILFPIFCRMPASTSRRAWIDRPFSGPGRCNWCLTPLEDTRCRWCSETCRDEFWCRASETYARDLVAERDQGVCALCGTDTQRQRAAFVRLCTWGEAGRWFSIRHNPRIAKQAIKKYGVPRG